MAKYKLTEDGVFDTELFLTIPNDDGNRHYAQYLEWVSAGNVPDPIPPTPEPTDEDVLRASDAEMIRTVDWFLDHFVSLGTVALDDLPDRIRTLYLDRKDRRTRP